MKTNKMFKDLMRKSGLGDELFADLLGIDLGVVKLYESEVLPVPEALVEEIASKLHLNTQHKFLVGDNLRHARKLRGYSVSDLAKSVHMKPADVYAIEDSAKPVSLLALDKMAIILNVALSELLTGDFRENEPKEHSMYPINCVLSETLDLFRKNKDHTIRDLARYLRVSEGRMNSFLRGTLPTVNELIKLSEILGVSMSDLTYDDDVKFRIVPKKSKRLCLNFSVFAKNLAYLINKYDYGQPDYLEFYLGFRDGVIKEYLTGKVGIPWCTIEKIAQYYGVNANSLRNIDLTV